MVCSCLTLTPIIKEEDSSDQKGTKTKGIRKSVQQDFHPFDLNNVEKHVLVQQIEEKKNKKITWGYFCHFVDDKFCKSRRLLSSN